MKNHYVKVIQSAKLGTKLNMDWDIFDIATQIAIDEMTVALGDMGMEPEFFRALFAKYTEVDKEYGKLLREDCKSQINRKYSGTEIERKLENAEAHDTLDKAIKRCIPEDMFTPYDERYKI